MAIKPFRWLLTSCLCWPLLVALPTKAETVVSPAGIEFALLKLGFTDAIKQLDYVVGQTVKTMPHRTGQSVSPTQLQQLEQVLLKGSGSESIRILLLANLANHLPENGDQAISRLDDQLLDRVANFDVSLEMRGAAEKFSHYQQTLKLSDIEARRIVLLRRMDSALQMSAIAAMLQTELAFTADFVATHFVANIDHPMRMIAGIKERELQLRQQHMAEVLLTLNLYSYRFMQLQELESYVTLLEHGSIQSLLSACRQALQQALLQARTRMLQGLDSAN